LSSPSSLVAVTVYTPPAKWAALTNSPPPKKEAYHPQLQYRSFPPTTSKGSLPLTTSKLANTHNFKAWLTPTTSKAGHDPHLLN